MSWHGALASRQMLSCHVACARAHWRRSARELRRRPMPLIIASCARGRWRHHLDVCEGETKSSTARKEAMSRRPASSYYYNDTSSRGRSVIMAFYRRKQSFVKVEAAKRKRLARSWCSPSRGALCAVLAPGGSIIGVAARRAPQKSRNVVILILVLNVARISSNCIIAPKSKQPAI